MSSSNEPFVYKVNFGQAWDNFISAQSNPINDLNFAAGYVHLAARIEIPMRIWSRVLRHPAVQEAYHELAVSDPHPDRCITCGAVRATFRPVLDRNTFELILQANAEGPILPGSLLITDSTDNAVLVKGRDPGRQVLITRPCHRLEEGF